MPVIALGLFAAGASGTGLLGSANSAGAIIGGIAVLALTRFQAKGLIVLWASLAYGLFLLAFGLTGSLITGIVLIALLGAADSVTVVWTRSETKQTKQLAMLDSIHLYRSPGSL